MYLSSLLGKIVLWLLKMTGRSGSTLPGLVVEKISPKYLAKTLAQLPKGVVVVTGTNGKTTTTKLLSELLRGQGLRVLSNDTGSNFVRGVVSTVVANVSLSGGLEYDIAIIEQDEAHAVHFVRLVKPRGVMVLNIARDQMDRFGEIDKTLQLVGKVAAEATEWVVLNANDPRVSKLSTSTPVTAWFGHNRELAADFVQDDQQYGGENHFFQAEIPDVSLEQYGSGKVSLKFDNTVHEFSVGIEGGHNAINIASAVAALRAIMPDFDELRLRESLKIALPAFGRGEVVKLSGGGRLQIQLVKNPSGFAHGLRALASRRYDAVAIIINDDFADGRDVSWLWDINFVILANAAAVYCGGTRASDMAVRLKYDGVTGVSIIPDVEVLSQELAPYHSSIVFCTYTAMLTLRTCLAKQDHNIRGTLL